jgi:hypothetical protein
LFILVTNGKLKKLRPTVTNPAEWDRKRPATYTWRKIRKRVLARDGNTCRYCGHSSWRDMHIHHIGKTDRLRDLVTVCVACHAVLHFGRNLMLKKIQIWRSEIPQVEIVRKTRAGIRDGMTLTAIKKALPLKRPGLLPCGSTAWARALIAMREKYGLPRMSLPEPYCAVFVDFVKWQLEPGPVKRQSSPLLKFIL